MKLQLLTQEMEKDLGLSEFSSIDTKVLLAVVDLHAQSGMATTSRILAHQLLKTFSRPSLFRSLKTLEASGKIEKATEKRGYYMPIHLWTSLFLLAMDKIFSWAISKLKDTKHPSASSQLGGEFHTQRTSAAPSFIKTAIDRCNYWTALCQFTRGQGVQKWHIKQIMQDKASTALRVLARSLQAGRTPPLDQPPPKSIECLMRGTQRDSARSY